MPIKCYDSIYFETGFRLSTWSWQRGGLMRSAVWRSWLSDPVDARIRRHIRSGKEGESHEYGKPIVFAVQAWDILKGSISAAGFEKSGVTVMEVGVTALATGKHSRDYTAKF